MSSQIDVNYDFRYSLRIPEVTIKFVNDCIVTIPSQYGGDL